MTKPLRILLIGSGYIHTVNYANLIQEDCEEIYLICDRKPDRFSHSFSVLDFSLKSISAQILTPRKIRKIIHSFKPDIIHVHQVSSFAFYAIRAARGMRIPIVLTAWGSDILLLPQRSFLMKKMVSYCLNRADATTADAAFMAEVIASLSRKTINDTMISVFGVELPTHSIEKEKVIYSNRLHKGLYRIDIIVLAFASFVNTEKGKDYTLWIAGEGEKTVELKGMVTRLQLENKVKFIGWCTKEENTNNYLRSEYFVSIPESDGTAVSLLEAMACGSIPILSNLPANNEWVKHGVNGYIINQINDHLFNALHSMDETAARDKNRIIIKDKASVEICRDNFVNLYRSLLN